MKTTETYDYIAALCLSAINITMPHREWEFLITELVWYHEHSLGYVYMQSEHNIMHFEKTPLNEFGAHVGYAMGVAM
eukprot:m.277655 g.277655  ORF g.277655 m.277655 type:complete len:77 (+) comp19784_c0_seq3:1070-1300(+)